MRIHVYSLCRSGHHAIAFWLAKNIVPEASVEVTIEGTKKMKLITTDTDTILDIKENEPIPESDEPSIVILRDPYNNFASFSRLVQNPNYGPISFFPFLKFWVDFAKEAAGETSKLSNKIFISYNDWVDSEDYRKEIVRSIEEKFHVKVLFDDSLKNHMTIYGGGSSFDGLQNVRTANMMKVHERYKYFEKSVIYRKAVDTPEIKNLSEKLFKFYPWKPVEKKSNSGTFRNLQDFFG